MYSACIESVIENHSQRCRKWTTTEEDEVEAEICQLMKNVMPRSNLLRPGGMSWFLGLERFVQGFFSDIPSVLVERLQDAAGSRLNPPIILAHEIGHALSLDMMGSMLTKI